MLVIVFVGLILTLGLLLADVPNLIDYQGRLTDDNGDPIDGNVSILFSIYNVETGGTALWFETQDSVDVNDGLFQVTLGSETNLPEDLFNGADRWVGIKVESDGEMTPRTEIVSVPYAKTDGDWTINGNDIYHENGVVGIGTTSPAEKLDVNGNLKVLGTASSGNTGIDLQISGSGSGKGGKVYIKAGDAQGNWSSNHWGGDIEIKAGTGNNNSGGDVKIEGGTSSIWTQSSLPTNVNIYGGSINGVYNSSGLITIEGGKQLGANSTNRSGGHILLLPGNSDGSGSSGNVGIGITNPVRTLHINDYMRLEPVSDPPAIPDEGDIYFDSDDHKLKCFDGSNWQDCW